MNIFNLSTLFFSFSSFLLGILILWRRQDKIGQKWFLFSCAASLWSFGLSLWGSNLFDDETNLAWDRVCHLGSVLIPSTWLDFICCFLGGRSKKGTLQIMAYLVSFILSLAVISPHFFAKPVSMWPFLYYTQPGPLYHLFTVFFFASVTYGFYIIVKAYRSATGARKQQLRYLLWATGIGFTGGSLTFFPVYGIPLPQYNLFVIPLYPFIVAYGVMRYRLLDIEEVVKAAQRDKLAAIGTLVASINHEIRNPLFIVKGMAESHLTNLNEGLYRNSEDCAVQANRILEKTVEQTQRALDIMIRLSDFAKQKPNEEAKVEAIDLSETIANVLPLVQHELELDKIEFIYQIPKNFPPLLVDKRHLEEIFFNLVINASQAMKETGGRIRISAKKKSDNMQETMSHDKFLIEICIADNGPGITQENLARIFEPFYSTKDTGTGLGLYVTKQLVEKNNGEIRVTSKLGEGTIFYIIFHSKTVLKASNDRGPVFAQSSNFKNLSNFRRGNLSGFKF
jgi:signal transduction histidine kinase